MKTKLRMLLIVIAMIALPLLGCSDDIDRDNLTEPYQQNAAAMEGFEKHLDSQ